MYGSLLAKHPYKEENRAVAKSRDENVFYVFYGSRNYQH